MLTQNFYCIILYLNIFFPLTKYNAAIGAFTTHSRLQQHVL